MSDEDMGDEMDSEWQEREPIAVGDWVWMPSSVLDLAGAGEVTKVEGDGINPCPCCGLGVGVVPLGQPNVSRGFAPAQLKKLDRPPVHGRGGKRR